MISRVASYPFIPLDGELHRALYLVSYWYLGLAALRNRSWLIAVGSLLNATIVTLNAGSMPKTGVLGDVFPLLPFGYYSFGALLVRTWLVGIAFRTSRSKE